MNDTRQDMPGKEVSCSIVPYLIDWCTARGMTEEAIFSGVTEDTAILHDIHERMSYLSFTRIFENVGNVFGEEGMEQLGCDSFVGKQYWYFRHIARLLYSCKELYVKGIDGPNSMAGRNYTNLTGQVIDLSPGVLRVICKASEGYELGRYWMVCTKGVLRSYPSLIGLPNAEVEMEYSLDQTSYMIRYPIGGVLARTRRLLMWPFAARKAAVELYEAHALLQRHYGELETHLHARESAEQALKESETRYRLLAEQMSDIIWLCGEDARIKYLSPAFAKLTGYPAATFLDKPFAALFVSEDTEKIRQLAELADSEEEQVPAVEARYRCEGKEPIWVEIRASRVAGEDGRSYLQGIARDISDRKESEITRQSLEAQLRHSQKMKSVGTFAGGIAHDFSNILQSVLGYCAMAKRDLAADHPAYTHVEHVLKAARRAKDLTLQIKTFSRDGSLQHRSVDISKAVRDALTLVKASIPETALFVENIQENCGHIQGDATQLHQIVMNLCANAFQALPGGMGTITITLKTDSTSDSAIMLSVADDGCGMNEATKARIFDPFFTTKEMGEGTGLGLAIVYGIVQSHKALIDVVTAPGNGTRVTVTFPQVLPVDAPKTAAPTHDTAFSGRVLFIDDDDSLVGLGVELLSSLGFTVAGYSESSQALAAFMAAPDQFDLLITDEVMPKLGGTELAQQMRSSRPDLPIIIMTGYSERIARHKLNSLDSFRILSKPFTPEELTSAIRHVGISFST